MIQVGACPGGSCVEEALRIMVDSEAEPAVKPGRREAKTALAGLR